MVTEAGTCVLPAHTSLNTTVLFTLLGKSFSYMIYRIPNISNHEKILNIYNYIRYNLLLQWFVIERIVESEPDFQPPDLNKK